MSDLCKVRIDGQETTVERDTTILQAATALGIEIPTLCHHPALEPYGSCRLCTVEVTERGRSRLVTSCNYPIRGEIEVHTSTERVLRGRKMIVELLWARCPDAAIFQQLGARYGIEQPRFEPREGELCYLCGLCVRFCNEIVGARAISFVGRGVDREVGTPFYKVSEACIACGACEFICPTGAIKVRDVTDKEPRPLLLDFDMGLQGRGNIFIPFPQAVPNVPVIDREHCLHFLAGTCGVCQVVCPPGAVDYEQQDEFLDVEVGAVVVATDQAGFDRLPLAEGPGFYRASPESPLVGSAAAARAMVDLFRRYRPGFAQAAPAQAMPARGARIGVFVCQCGGEISHTVNTGLLRDRAAAWPGVVHSQVLAFSCSPEAADTITAQAEAHDLDQVVLAACSCCAIDQACSSCTYQRTRCKENLGIFGQVPGPAGFEFVNIREQCAWVHRGEPAAATSKATALVAAAVARARLAAAPPVELPLAEKSALIVGSGGAAETCQRALQEQGIAVSRVQAPHPGAVEHGPELQVQRREGRYVATRDGVTRQGVALVLAPGDGRELERLLSACSSGQDGLRPRIDARGGGVETHRPGIMVCDPLGQAEVVGPAAAARVAAWLGSATAHPRPTAARVDAARCRACATCIAVCDYGAPQMVGQEPRRTSWIDPAICTGCGTCVAHCPSGAISGGYSTEAQIEAMLEQLMAGPRYAGAEQVGRTVDQDLRIVVLTCNWNAYSALETAGAERRQYSPAVHSLKVMCLGQLSPGTVLKAFEKGADGVLLLGCPPGECHFEFGNHRAEELFAEAKRLAGLLGYGERQLKLDSVGAGQGEAFHDKVQAFVRGLRSPEQGSNGDRGQ